MNTFSNCLIAKLNQGQTGHHNVHAYNMHRDSHYKHRSNFSPTNVITCVMCTIIHDRRILFS